MMARFRYLAATPKNETHNGIIEAGTVQEALVILRGRGLCVIRIGTPTRLSLLWSILNQDVIWGSPVRPAELARLSQEWAELIEAGISLEESLALLDHTNRSGIRRVLSTIREAVKAGMALHEALSRFPGAFPPVYRALIQAGEVAGNLGPTLRRLGDDLTARRALTEEIRNALLYPLFLFVTATAGIMVLLLVVVPNLESLIGEGGDEKLPAVTHYVLAISHILRDYGFALTAATAASATVISLLIMAPAGRAHLDIFILKAPLLGSLVKIVETGRFARTFGALLAGGVAVSPAMRIASDTVANRRMRSGLAQAHESIISGVAIGDAIAASGVFEEDAIGLIRVGERTGHLARILEQMATLHEARAARRLKALTVMLTPAMTIIFGVLAGSIVYAMLSTILSINELASL